MVRWGFMQPAPLPPHSLSKVVSSFSLDMMMEQMACVGECKRPSFAQDTDACMTCTQIAELLAGIFCLGRKPPPSSTPCWGTDTALTVGLGPAAADAAVPTGVGFTKVGFPSSSL